MNICLNYCHVTIHQFNDPQVIILLASAAVGLLVIALQQKGTCLTAFVGPAVVSDPCCIFIAGVCLKVLMFCHCLYDLDS